MSSGNTNVCAARFSLPQLLRGDVVGEREGEGGRKSGREREGRSASEVDKVSSPKLIFKFFLNIYGCRTSGQYCCSYACCFENTVINESDSNLYASGLW